MTEFALKTEIEIFEYAGRLLIVCPNLPYLLTQAIEKETTSNLYSGQDQKLRVVFRCCTVDILNWPLP